MILNQTDTGKPCPNDIDSLKKRIDDRGNRSMMMYISVHCWSLAKVLDRLEYLEDFEKRIKSLIKDIQ